MRTRPLITTTVIVTSLLGAAATTASAQSLYEGFDYTPGTTTFGGGSGYSAPWFRTFLNADFEPVETTDMSPDNIVAGLTYINGRPVVSQGNAYSPQVGGFADIRRRTATPISGDPANGGNRSTVWMSFLFKSGPVPEDGNLVSLTREFVDFVPKLTLAASRRSTATDTENFARVRLWDQFGERGPDGPTTLLPPAVNLLVLEYIPDNTPSGTNEGILRGYLNPTLNGAAPDPATAFGSVTNGTEGLDPFTLMRIRSGPGGETFRAIFDEVRVGTTFGEAVRQARPGDTNADGIVNFDDLLILAQNYNTVAAQGWYSGDFSLNGLVDFDDLLSLAQNYNTSGVNATLGSREFQSDWAMAQSLVPEPAMLSVLSLAALPLRRRRR